MNFDIVAITRQAESRGWKVKPTKSGHYCFLAPDKSIRPIYVSSTPSDWRAIHKIKAQFRRAGLELS